MKKLFQKLIILVMFLGATGVSNEFIAPNATVQAARTTRSHKKHRTHKTRRTKKRKRRQTKHSYLQEYNVYIGVPKDSADYSAVIDAIQAWNDTKAIKFTIISNPANAYIDIVNGNYGPMSTGDITGGGIAGETRTGYVNNDGLTHSSIKLNDYYLGKQPFSDSVAVVEHELGHSMGLGHITGQPSLMNPSYTTGHANQILPIDIANAKAINIHVY